jgi:hypothetical protein
MVCMRVAPIGSLCFSETLIALPYVQLQKYTRIAGPRKALFYAVPERSCPHAAPPAIMRTAAGRAELTLRANSSITAAPAHVQRDCPRDEHGSGSTFARAPANPTHDSVRARFAPSAALAPPTPAKRRPSLGGWSSGWGSLPFGRDDRTRAHIGDIALSSACGTNRNFAGCVPAAWLFPAGNRRRICCLQHLLAGRPIWMDANAHRRPPRRASLCASYSRPADQNFSATVKRITLAGGWAD